MHILNSAIQFSAVHQSVQRQEVRESLRVWHTDPPSQAAPAEPATDPQCAAAVSANPGDLQLVLLQLLIERLTGRKMKLADLSGLMDASAPEIAAPDRAATGQPRPDWGAVYERQETRFEAESLQFAASGVIRTAEGQEIQIALSLTMSREFMSSNRLELRAGAAALKDPLVINFNGNAAQLTDRQFSFDLDADGTKENVPLLAGSSAFLALDRNGDGTINDGRELFGTASGSGFADLATYDLDHNGWIDESDPVFSQLKLWLPGAIQSGYLSSLKERGIGALYLGAAASPFELKTGDELAGRVRETGLYLNEDGSAGTLQQVDLKA